MPFHLRRLRENKKQKAELKRKKAKKQKEKIEEEQKKEMRKQIEQEIYEKLKQERGINVMDVETTNIASDREINNVVPVLCNITNLDKPVYVHTRNNTGNLRANLKAQQPSRMSLRSFLKNK